MAGVGDVLVLQHTMEDDPAYLGEWLDAQGAVWQAPCAEAGDAYPTSVAGYRALAVLGGEWGANDERPSLRQAENLIRQADAMGMPVLGHCLGGQLIARALGGQVSRLAQPEMGWLPIETHPSPEARQWLGDHTSAMVYQWHYDGVTTLPPGAQCIAHSPACAHQAFVLGPHLAMQFHIEITPRKMALWLQQPGTAYPAALQAGVPTVQDPDTMHALSHKHQAASQALADRLYGEWKRRWLAA